MKLLINLSAAILVFFCLFNEARADWVSKHAAMSCDAKHNIALIRFGMVSNSDDKSLLEGPILLGELKRKYGEIEKNYSDECIFTDGRKVTIKDRTSQAYAYGMGGGDPSASFSMLIDGKPIYYWDEWYSGYIKSTINRALVILDDKNLYSCKPSDQDQQAEHISIDKQNCVDESSRLKFDITGKEKESFDRDKKIENYKEVGSNKDVCKYFRDTKNAENDDIFKVVERDSPFSILSTANIDVNNDKKVETVYRVHGYAGYFDGSYFIYFRSKEDESSFSQCAFSGVCPSNLKNPNDVDEIVENINLTWPSAKIISAKTLGDLGKEYMTRYTWIYSAVLNGKLYFYFIPNDKVKFPHSVIGQISSDDHFSVICTYKDSYEK